MTPGSESWPPCCQYNGLSLPISLLVESLIEDAQGSLQLAALCEGVSISLELADRLLSLLDPVGVSLVPSRTLDVDVVVIILCLGAISSAKSL